MIKQAVLGNIVTTLIGLFGAVAVEVAAYLNGQTGAAWHVVAAVVLALGAAAKDGHVPAPIAKVAPLLLLCALPGLARAAPVMIEHHYLQAPPKTATGKYADTPPVPIDTSTCVPVGGGLLCPGLTMSLARLSFSGTVSAAVDPGVGVVLVYGTGLSQLGVGLYGSLATTPGDQGGALSVIVSILAGYLDLGIGGRLIGDTTVFDSGKNAYIFTSLNLLKIAGVTQ